MTAQKTLRDCIDCGRALRPMKAKKADWPGTRIHQGRSLCSTDYKKRYAAGTLDLVAPLQRPHSDTPFEVADIPEPEAKRLEKLTREQIDFHLAWRRRKGMDTTQPINLTQIMLGAAA